MKQNYPIGVSMEKAIEIIKNQISVANVEEIPLEKADNRILAENITALEPVPPFDRSPYDGYAFRSEDVQTASRNQPVQLRIIEEVPAGRASARIIHQGEAIKILTGAPIPEGADVVEKYESTVYTDETVKILVPLEPGSNICRAGEDIEAGTTILERGTPIEGAKLGMLAALGYSTVKCHEKIRCVIISTGSELLPVKEALKPGKIRSSSGYMLQSLIASWGMDCDLYGIVEDSKEQIAKIVDSCTDQYDVIISTGGVSVGDYDFLEQSLDSLNATILLSRVQMKPGMAFIAGMYRDKLILSLSGNPSAAAAVLHLVGREVLAYMSGIKDSPLKKCKVYLSRNFSKKSNVRRFLPGVMEYRDGKVYLKIYEKYGNGMISPWDGCNIIGVIPEGAGPLKEGELIDAYYF